MMMMVHHDNRGRPDQRCDGGDGPTFNRPPGAAAAAAAGSSNNSSGGSVSRALQPFQYIANSNTHHHTTTAFRSPGLCILCNPFSFQVNANWFSDHSFLSKYLKVPVFINDKRGMNKKAEAEPVILFFAGGMTTALGFPFTNLQWKELERQAMIYKYMMAALPVPRDLLFPTTSAPTVSQSPCNFTYQQTLFLVSSNKQTLVFWVCVLTGLGFVCSEWRRVQFEAVQ